MPQLVPDLPADVLFAEAQAARRHDTQPALSLSARYSFKNWYDQQGKLREFSCRMTGITPYEMALIVPVIGQKGRGHYGGMRRVRTIGGHGRPFHEPGLRDEKDQCDR